MSIQQCSAQSSLNKRANSLEPSDVKSPVSPPSLPHQQPVFHPHFRGSGVASSSLLLLLLGGCWMAAGSLTSGVNLRFLFDNSRWKLHDDAALGSASPLRRPKSEVSSAVSPHMLYKIARWPSLTATEQAPLTNPT